MSPLDAALVPGVMGQQPPCWERQLLSLDLDLPLQWCAVLKLCKETPGGAENYVFCVPDGDAARALRSGGVHSISGISSITSGMDTPDAYG